MKHPQLRILRQMRNLKQEYMAEELGISQKQYSRLENGQCKLSIERMTHICELFGITTAEFMSFGTEQSITSS